MLPDSCTASHGRDVPGLHTRAATCPIDPMALLRRCVTRARPSGCAASSFARVAVRALLAGILGALLACQGKPSPSQSASGTQETTATLLPGSQGGGSGTPVQFPTTTVGQPAAKTVQVKNTTKHPFTVRNVSASGPVTVSQDNCSGATLSPGSTCQFTIVNLARSRGHFRGVLTVETSIGITTVPILGEAVASSTTAPPSTIPPPPTVPSSSSVSPTKPTSGATQTPSSASSAA
jgi:hypothetical protein